MIKASSSASTVYCEAFLEDLHSTGSDCVAMIFSTRHTALVLAVIGLTVSATPIVLRAEDIAVEGAHTGQGNTVTQYIHTVIHPAPIGTFYRIGLGACGWYNNDNDYVVAIGHDLFDNYPYVQANGLGTDGFLR